MFVVIKKMPSNTNFKGVWLCNDEYKDWVTPDTTNQHHARYIPCCKTFYVTAMGESTLKSHLEAEKKKQRQDVKPAKRRCTDEEIDTMKTKKGKFQETVADLSFSRRLR